MSSPGESIYCAYGLTLESDRLVESLHPVKDRKAVDVALSLNAMPGWAAKARLLPAKSRRVRAPQTPTDSSGFSLFELGAGEFFQLKYRDQTSFIVDRDATRIWGEVGPGLSHEDLVVYLVGPVMGFVLRRRGILALHASCFCVRGEAFALCGRAGTGKSTAAAALALQGVPILCEDIAALQERSPAFHVCSGYPRINLWPDSVVKLFSSGADLPKIAPNWEKRFLPLDDHSAKFEFQERPLAAIYVLEPRSDDPSVPRIEDVSPQDAALLLVQNTYMNYLLDKQQRAQEFDAIARLVAQVPVRRLTPSSNPAKIAAMCELLESTAAADGEDFAARCSASRPG